MRIEAGFSSRPRKEPNALRNPRAVTLHKTCRPMAVKYLILINKKRTLVAITSASYTKRLLNPPLDGLNGPSH